MTQPLSSAINSSSHSKEASTDPRKLARGAAIFFVLTLLGGVFAQGLIADRLIVHNDAAATAANIAAHQSLYELAFAIYMVEMACQVATCVFFYRLLRPAGRTLALLSLAMGLTGTIIKTAGRAFFLAPLFLSSSQSAHYLSSFSVDQVQALALVMLTLDDRAAGIGLAFFGFEDVLRGWVMLKARFLPKWIGVVALISGLCWVTWIYPVLARVVFMPAVVFALASSAATVFYLLVYAVDPQKWHEQNNG